MYKKHTFEKPFAENRYVLSAQIMRKHWTGKEVIRLDDLSYHATALFWLQKRGLMFKRISLLESKPETQPWNPWYSHKSNVIAVQSRLASSFAASEQRDIGTLAMEPDTRTNSTPSDTLSSLNTSLDAFTAMANAAWCRDCLFENYRSSKWNLLFEDKYHASASSRDFSLRQWLIHT